MRQALNVAIDRNLINNKFFKGSGIPDPVEFFPPWRADCKDEWAPHPGPDGGTGCTGGGWPYPYDPQMGRDLLAEAGYPEGFDLTFYASPNLGGVPEIPDVAEAMAAMWGAIGVNVDLQVAQSDVVRSLQTAHDWTGSVNLVRYSIDPVSLSMSFLWRKSTRAFMEHEFITEWKEAYDQTLDPDTRFAGNPSVWVTTSTTNTSLYPSYGSLPRWDSTPTLWWTTKSACCTSAPSATTSTQRQ